MKIKEMPKEGRPRERLRRFGWGGGERESRGGYFLR